MSNTMKHAVVEFDILEATVEDAIIAPFRKEILALVDAFGKSGQSGGSAPFTAGAISVAVRHLCLQQPICPITGDESEWSDVIGAQHGSPRTYQNIRLSSVFKDGVDGWHLASLSESRETPMKLPATLKEEYEFTVQVPSGFTLANELVAMEVDNTVGKLKISIAQKKDQYTVNRMIEFHQESIGPEAYGYLRQLLDAWYDQGQRKLVFKLKD